MKKKGVIYYKNGIAHSEDSFKELIEKNLPTISKMVNVEERIKVLRKEKNTKAK